MSYLELPRVVFKGRFQADVNTVNNDVRNFDSEVFEPRFQERQARVGDNTEYNGWWNPDGSNAYRLLDCAVTGGVQADGSPFASDLVENIRIDANLGRPSAKIVDLDPQWQMASGIWGLRLTLTGPQGEIVSGNWRAASFRDLFFGRLAGVGGSGGASARFTNVLEDLTWGPGLAGSPIAQALKAVADAGQGRLSLSLLTYGYSRGGAGDNFTLGDVMGTIGPWSAGEPLSFARGRRLAPVLGPAPFSNRFNFGFATAAPSPDGARLSLDLGVSAPLVSLPGSPPVITLTDQGPLKVVVLAIPDDEADVPEPMVGAGIAEGAVVTAAQYVEIATVAGYDAAWFLRTGGIADLPVPAAAAGLIADHPVAILQQQDAQEVVILREAIGGLWARAETFVQRIDAAVTGLVAGEVDIHAYRYGAPWSGGALSVTLLPPASGAGGTGDDDEVNPPQTTIPANNVPPTAIQGQPAALTAGADGVATWRFAVADPKGVRGYIDGQIFAFNYGPGVQGASPASSLEVIVAHVRDAFEPPATPSWSSDIQPILQQYDNLYPVMSRRLFSLSNYDTVVKHARILHHAFSRPLEDPNHMPVTRDLSAGKQRMLLDWLATLMVDAPPLDGAAPVPPEGGALEPPPTAAPLVLPAEAPRAFDAQADAALGPSDDGKGTAVRAFLASRTQREG